MPIRITGMNSNLDTDSIVQELVKAASAKKTKMEKSQLKLSYKQDAWKSLNSKIHTFFKKTLSDMQYASTYRKKITTVSNSNIASIVSSDKAVNGSQTLAVNKLAKAGSLTGGKLITKTGAKATAETKLSELGKNGLSANGASISVTTGGKTTNLSFNSDSTIEDVVTSLNEAGVTASFDAANQRIFLNTTKSGKDNDFSLTANNMAGLDSLAHLGLLTSKESIEGSETAKWIKYKGATDADTLKNLVDAGEVKTREEERAAAILADSKNRIKAISDLSSDNTALADVYATSKKGQLDTTLADSYNQSIFAAAGITDLGSTADLASIDTEKLSGASKALQDKLKELQEMPTDAMTDDDIAALEAKKEALQKDINHIDFATNIAKAYQTNETSIQTHNTALADNATYIEEVEQQADGSYAIKTETDAEGNQVEVSKATATTDLTDAVGAELVAKVNATAAMDSYNVKDTASETAVRVNAEDAEILLNGAAFTSSTNSFSINGLNITAKELTKGQEVSITTADDVDGVYNVIKNFFKGYNELVNEMDASYNATSAKGYEPLTDEEKANMTDSEIEKWENKIKDSILRRDSTLSTVISSIKTKMLQSVSVNGKNMTLADFGIATLGYFGAKTNERGAYHIDGDQSDESTGGNPDKLKSMIANDPETVIGFFTQLTGSLYEEMNNQMKSTDYRSVYHVYDDKKMQKEYDDYTKKIKKQETKLQELEDKYYKQFTAMEVALAKMQGNQNAISSLLGG